MKNYRTMRFFKNYERSQIAKEFDNKKSLLFRENDDLF